MKRLTILIVLASSVLGACTTTTGTEDGVDTMPSWVESVFPEPGAVVTAGDAVEVDHSITATDNDIRLG